MRGEAIDIAVGHGVDAITGRIRHGHDPIWPVDRPFPLSDAECAALVRGHAVKWDGDPEYLNDLPGMYETRDGYAIVHTWQATSVHCPGLRGCRDDPARASRSAKSLTGSGLSADLSGALIAAAP